MAKHHERHIREIAHGNIMQALFILQIGHKPARVRIAQRTVIHARFAMADMIVRIHGEARLIKGGNHVQIATGMLAIAVHQLDYPARRTQRRIGPGAHGIAAISGRKRNLSQGHKLRLRFSYKMQFKVLFRLNVLIIYEIGHFVNDNSICK